MRETWAEILIVMTLMFAGFVMCFSAFDDEVEAGSAAFRLIEQCEAELPRNQHCKLVAIPEETE